jgi:hypothetical protein
MDSEDTFTERLEGSSRARRLWRWFLRPPRSAEPLDDHDVLLELSSVDMTVRFFEDRLEYHRRLGSKHGTVAYRAIRVARLVSRSSLLVKQPVSTRTDTSHDVAKKLVLTLQSRAKALTFDFRSEPIETVREAFLLIDRGLQR